MKVRVEVVSLNTDGEEQRRQILTIERRELAMETQRSSCSDSLKIIAYNEGIQSCIVHECAAGCLKVAPELFQFGVNEFMLGTAAM
jgi:hypothetical protein